MNSSSRSILITNQNADLDCRKPVTVYFSFGYFLRYVFHYFFKIALSLDIADVTPRQQVYYYMAIDEIILKST